MAWGLGGVPSSRTLAAPGLSHVLEATALQRTLVWSAKAGPGLGRPTKPPRPRLNRHRGIAQGEDALPLPSGATSPFPRQ